MVRNWMNIWWWQFSTIWFLSSIAPLTNVSISMTKFGAKYWQVLRMKLILQNFLLFTKSSFCLIVLQHVSLYFIIGTQQICWFVHFCKSITTHLYWHCLREEIFLFFFWCPMRYATCNLNQDMWLFFHHLFTDIYGTTNHLVLKHTPRVSHVFFCGLFFMLFFFGGWPVSHLSGWLGVFAPNFWAGGDDLRLLLFCEHRWDGVSIYRWWGYPTTICCHWTFSHCRWWGP